MLLYLYLSTFSLRDRQRQLKFLWLSPAAKLNKCYLALGTLTMLIVSIFSLLIPYMLFRLDPSTTDMLLNALALDFMVHADEALVRNLEGNHSFNGAIRRARARLSAIPKDTNVVTELAEIEGASWCALLGGFCRSSAMRGEVGYRLGRLLYRVIAFCVLALSITGGHIAHVHGRAVLYFIGLWPQVPRGSNQWLVINKSASNPDEKYWLSAAVDLAILAARTRRRRPPTPSPRHLPSHDAGDHLLLPLGGEVAPARAEAAALRKC